MSYIIPIIALGGLYYMYTKQPTLNALEANGEQSFTLYYWNKCGHCKEMMPEWLKLGRECHNVHIRQIEASNNTEASGIDSYPTMVYRHKGSIEEYKGARTKEAFSKYLELKQAQKETPDLFETMDIPG